MPRGALLLVLHAHLPFVRHPEDEDFLEEDWLHEAIVECYLPLLEVLERLAADSVPAPLTLTLSPTLLSMWEDPLLVSRTVRRLDAQVELAEAQVQRTSRDASFGAIARFDLDRLRRMRWRFHDVHQRDLVGAFRRLGESGGLELITCAATHAFLPLLRHQPAAMAAQVAIGSAHHRRALGRAPTGIWLPECGYVPGLERALAAEELRFTFLDAHGITHAAPRPLASVYAPLFTGSGVAVYGRDPESSEQVWSADRGYPGDPFYRDFYRDLGWERPIEELAPLVRPGGPRRATGLKWWRITGPTDAKAPYDPTAAAARARVHAEDFVARRLERLAALENRMERAPVLVAPYDAELFGHWWFEGPQFLEAVARSAQARGLRLSTPPMDLEAFPENQLAAPAESSWGEKGYAAMWLDPKNDWIARALAPAAERMIALARSEHDPPPLRRRALNQAARELLLAQSSDFPFILRTGTVSEYAASRVRMHLQRFDGLAGQLRRDRLDEAALAVLEAQDDLFPELDYRVYARPPP